MKQINFFILSVCFLYNSVNLIGQTMPKFEIYDLKYYLTDNETYQTDGVMYIRDKIIELFQEKSHIASFKYSSMETITNKVDTNVSFQYDYYHIYNGSVNRIVVSKRAEVKYDGIFYYRVVIGNKTYLATK